MRETLETYRPEESRSFLMILNAVEDLLRTAPPPAPRSGPVAADPAVALAALVGAWRERRAGLVPSAGGVGALELHLAAGFEARLGVAAGRLARRLGSLAGSPGDGPRIAGSFAAIARHAVAAWAAAAQRRPAELLLELEHALLIVEAWARLAELTLIIGEHV
jgi:hypothetical protein